MSHLVSSAKVFVLLGMCFWRSKSCLHACDHAYLKREHDTGKGDYIAGRKSVSSLELPLIAGMDANGQPCEGCVDVLPQPGTREYTCCHAAFFAILLLLFSTGLIWRALYIYTIGALASKALLGNKFLFLISE